MAQVVANKDSNSQITFTISGLEVGYVYSLNVFFNNNQVVIKEDFVLGSSSYSWIISGNFEDVTSGTLNIVKKINENYSTTESLNFTLSGGSNPPSGNDYVVTAIPHLLSAQIFISYSNNVSGTKTINIRIFSDSSKQYQIDQKSVYPVLPLQNNDPLVYDFYSLNPNQTYYYDVTIQNDNGIFVYDNSLNNYNFTTTSYTLETLSKTQTSIIFRLSGFDLEHPYKKIIPKIGASQQTALYPVVDSANYYFDISFTNLSPGTEYQFSITVLAQNIYNEWVYNESGVAKTESTLSDIFICEINNITSNSATVNYVSGLDWLNSSVSFQVFLNNVQQSNVNTFLGSSWNYIFSNLSAGTYTVNVQFSKDNQLYYAVNSQGQNLQFTISSVTPPPSGGDGQVKIYINGQWLSAVPYIYTGGEWRRAEAYVYTVNEWKKTTGT